MRKSAFLFVVAVGIGFSAVGLWVLLATRRAERPRHPTGEAVGQSAHAQVPSVGHGANGGAQEVTQNRRPRKILELDEATYVKNLTRIERRLNWKTYNFALRRPPDIQKALQEVGAVEGRDGKIALLKQMLERPKLQPYQAELHIWLADYYRGKDWDQFEQSVRSSEAFGDSPTAFFEFEWRKFTLASMTSSGSWVESANKVPWELYFDSFDDHKIAFPERWGGVALHRAAWLAKCSSRKDLSAGYLEELRSKQPHADYLESDKAFLSERLRETPWFAAYFPELYYIRVEDLGSYDLAESHYAKDGNYSQALAVMESLKAKYSDLPIPNVPLLWRMAELQIRVGDREGAGRTLQEAREALRAVEDSEPVKALYLEPSEKEFMAANPWAEFWPHTATRGAKYMIEQLGTRLREGR